MNFLQEFEMNLGNLTGLLAFEDGSTSVFSINDSLQIENASAIDAAGDADGDVEFEFIVLPEAELSNLTELGFNIGGGVDVLSGSAGYDASFTFFGETIGFSDSFSFGPLAGFDFSVPVAEISVFDDTFDLAFEQEIITAYA